MAPSAIPGFDAAVAKERAARNGVYLGTLHLLCGFRVNHITPRLLSILTEARTPFIFGGDISEETPFIQFILALLPCKTNDERAANLLTVTKAAMDADLEEWDAQISDLIALTFLDSPQGSGGDEAPIASACAWMEYRMGCEPFRWDYETKTADVPLRRIYQLIRCDDREKGRVVVNSLSGKCEGDWLDTVNAGLADGSITPKMIEELQARAVYRKAGKPYPGDVELSAAEATHE